MANEIIAGLGFHHIGLKAANFERSVAFYTALGFKPVASWIGGSGDPITMFDLGDGGILELFGGGGDHLSTKGKWVHFAMKVDSVDRAYEAALAAGAVSISAPKSVPLDSKPEKMTIRVAFVAGPDGEELEFFKKEA